jgi:hypothetical protein
LFQGVYGRRLSNAVTKILALVARYGYRVDALNGRIGQKGDPMPITAEGTAPYAPPSTVLSLIARARERGLPSPVTRDVLGRAGVPESLAQRTIQSLELLELIDADGTHTQNLEVLRLTPEPEYKARFAEIIRGVYADVFTFVDPAKDGAVRVRDAFRTYIPTGQQGRMVTLFLGLCQASGIIQPGEGRPVERDIASSGTKARPKPAPQLRQKPKRSPSPANLSLPAPLAALLQSLPNEGEGWPKASRENFVRTFGAVLDFCYPIEEPETNGIGTSQK